MIDFSDKAQLGCFIGVVAALACLAAALIVMTARMKKRLSGGAFAAWLTAAIIVVVAGIAACLISIIFKTEFLKLDCVIVDGALSIVHDGNTLFTVPGLGVFFGVAFEHAVIELLMYGVTLLALALVALTCIRRGVSRAVWSRDVDGEGYYVVSGDDEQSAFEPIETETSDDENAAQPENAETAEKEAAEEPETAEITEKEAAIEPEETEVKPIETVEEPEAAEEETVVSVQPETVIEQPEVAVEEPVAMVEEPEAAEEKTIETVEEPEVAEEEEVVSPQPKPTEELTDATAPVEPIEVKEPTDATAPTEPIAAETPAENKPTAAKRHRAVKSRAAQVFGEYLDERNEEDREKLLGKIDIITKRTD